MNVLLISGVLGAINWLGEGVPAEEEVGHGMMAEESGVGGGTG